MVARSRSRRGWASGVGGWSRTIPCSVRCGSISTSANPTAGSAPKRKRAAAEWLADRLLELINVDTGAPVVAAVYFTDDYYERVAGDPMGDLVVEWNRDAPIDTVWSPATGVVTAPYLQWRTGDHHRAGLLLASGPGIEPGRRSGKISVLDVAPTLAASLGVEPPPIDGIARADLVPETVRNDAAARPIDVADRSAVERPAVATEGSAPLLAAGVRRARAPCGCRSSRSGCRRHCTPRTT